MFLIPARDTWTAAQDHPAPAAVTKEKDYEGAPADGRYDASRQVARAKWTACGCAGVYFGAAASLLFVASPRAERLLGKSPEYVMLYTRAYKKAMRGHQFRWAALGCATTSCLVTAFVIAVNSDDALLDCGPDITCGLNDDCQSWVDNTHACLESSQDCGETMSGCGDNIGDCSPDCSPDCSSPECGSQSCGENLDCSPDCGSPDCGDNLDCGGSSDCGSSDCGGSSSNCGSLTGTAGPEVPLE
jgi:hypothetical protein